MNDFLASSDGAVIVTFLHETAPLWALNGTDQSAWVQTCRTVGTQLNSDVDAAKLATAAGAIPDTDVAELVMDQRTIVSNLLIACNQGDLTTTQAQISRGIVVDTALSPKLGGN